MSSTRTYKRMGVILIAVLLFVVTIGGLSRFSESVVANSREGEAVSLLTSGQASATGGRTGYVLRFDPDLESFETFTLPTQGANPVSLVISPNLSNLEVWFTEPDVDQIGRLVYTTTSDYTFYEYPIDGEPLNLVQDNDYLWFTARAGNYIGRIEMAGGQVVTFSGLMAGSRPSGIDAASDGSIWFTENAADQIGHLVVTSTNDYQVTEYPIPDFAGMAEETSAPYGILVKTDDEIWFSETARDQLVRLQPSIYPFNPSQAFAHTGPTQNGEGYPLNLDYDTAASRLWFTEWLGNYVTLYFLSTNSFGLQYAVPTASSRPYDLALDSSGRVWFTEQKAGNLGRLTLTTTAQINEYPLPFTHVMPTGVAVDPGGKVWLAAATWHTVYLPAVLNRYPLPTPPFGVQTYWSVDDAHGLQEMQAAGVTWLRLLLNWQVIEPEDTTPEHFQWATYDAWFRNLQEANIRPIVAIQGNPEWAAAYGGGPLYPEHLEDFSEFVGALVERYDGDGIADAPGSPVVNHWEFYNEADNGSVLLAESGYGYWGHNGADYADLLKQVRPIIKAANPKAQMLNSGLAYERFEENGEGPYVRRFLDDFLAAGGGNYIDIFNFHYYPNFAWRWESYGHGVIGKTNYLRNLLTSYGVYKPFVCTEIGTHSDTSRGGSYELQSRYVVQSFVRSMASDIDVAIWFTLRDMTGGFPYPYGLLNETYNPKPAYNAYSTLTTQLAGARYVRALTVQETGTDAIEGYVLNRDMRQTIYVLWTNDGAIHSFNLPVTSIERVDKFGASAVVVDADDGTTDGIITLEVEPSPVYLKIGP